MRPRPFRLLRIVAASCAPRRPWTCAAIRRRPAAKKAARHFIRCRWLFFAHTAARRWRPQAPSERPAARGGAGAPARVRPLVGRLTRGEGPLGAGAVPNEAGSVPARAIVTPPHLPAKMNGFYAGMRRALGAAWRGSRGDGEGESSTRFYALWLCSLGIGRHRDLTQHRPRVVSPALKCKLAERTVPVERHRAYQHALLFRAGPRQCGLRRGRSKVSNETRRRKGVPEVPLEF